MCTTTATSTSPVGIYATSCSGAAAGNYAINYATGEATVGQATLTITASSGAITYGGAAPTITACVLRLREWRYLCLFGHAADLHDHRDVPKPGGQLRQ